MRGQNYVRHREEMAMRFVRNKEAKREKATEEWSAEQAIEKLKRRGNLVNELLKEGVETKVYLDYDEYGEIPDKLN